MPALGAVIQPLVLDDPRKATESAHQRLRELIYSGALPAGSVLSQVELAAALGISRTPLREAIRRLQAEGLIEAELNRRCRVAGFDAEDLDAVYGTRLMVEALGMQLTLPRIPEADLREAEEHLRVMADDPEPGVSPRWRAAHTAFHDTFTAGAPAAVTEQLATLVERSQRYVALLSRSQPHGNPQAAEDHSTILALVHDGDHDAAIALSARHHARHALMLLADVAAELEPVSIRAALGLIAVTRSAPLDARRRRSA